MQTTRVLASLSALLIISGCSSIRQHIAPDEDNLLSGAGSIAVMTSASANGEKKAEEYELIDIDKLLEKYGLDKPQDLPFDQSKRDKYKYLRNDLQDRLIAASNQRCGAYLRVLTTSKAQTQMGWSGLATFLSGAASVATPASAVKTLAAGSTVSNAFLSLYNEAYFNNLTVSVISAGIGKQREGLLEQITKQREKPLPEYPVNRAIADALAYHSACNIISGLETAASAAKTVEATKVVPQLQ